ncbi:DUF1045 domain-containing protein [Sulfitobacter guttiformis]|uniref:Uncharacterized protein DUF1045 n=1 Tax=Sulfitobacter guttiformis TaxID=74349 RepID=A0A420DTS4_9RHOB|nr:DUF1045 domain-containing protein [Sulfitobacter guttiformis]KIN71023.1 putative xylose isomerase [Sulfitobacter guttiformis KCTC 32187]RKE97507.1 uncharacterized protein DUF1045 [Sulfitobacter guttiformis]
MFERYAVFYTPTGDLADFGAAWLGWDSARGTACAPTELEGVDIERITATPRKYGLHGTLKAPFRLAKDTCQSALEAAIETFAERVKPCPLGSLDLRHQNGFIALRPAQDGPLVQDFAAEVIKAFDPFRAPLSDAEIARRRKARLSARQDAQLLAWGYPFIFEDFHFHLTLSGSMPAKAADPVMAALRPCLMDKVADPFTLDAVTLMGEDSNGLFHQIHRYALTG